MTRSPIAGWKRWQTAANTSASTQGRHSRLRRPGLSAAFCAGCGRRPVRRFLNCSIGRLGPGLGPFRADIEKNSPGGHDAGDVRSGSPARAEDEAWRRLVSFGLGPQLKTNFEQIFSAPFFSGIALAELGPEPGRRLIFRLHFDGAYRNAVSEGRRRRQRSGGRSGCAEMG